MHEHLRNMKLTHEATALGCQEGVVFRRGLDVGQRRNVLGLAQATVALLGGEAPALPSA